MDIAKSKHICYNRSMSNYKPQYRLENAISMVTAVFGTHTYRGLSGN